MLAQRFSLSPWVWYTRDSIPGRPYAPSARLRPEHGERIRVKDTRLRALNTQIRRLQGRLETLHRLSTRASWIRLGLAAAALVAAGAAYFAVGAWLLAICLGAGGLLFGMAVIYHRQVDTSIRRHQAWLQYAAAQIARATLDWEQIPTTFGHRPQPDHPFETDLDLVGPRSLHRLLDTAVSYEGSHRLRAWLAEPVPVPAQTLRRQRLVRELVPLSLFRARLAVNATVAAGAKRTWQAGQLLGWLEDPAPQGALRRWFLGLGAFAGLNAILFVADQLGWFPPWWQISLVVYVGVVLARARLTDAAWRESLALQGALQQLRDVFRLVETFSYQNTPHLRALCEPFLDPAHRPSRYLARLTRIVAAMGLRANPLIGFAVNALLPWDAYLVYQLAGHKAEMARHAPAWMDAWFELEALSSLASFGYLNPGYTFPDLLAEESGDGGAVFDAQDLGHPLLSDAEKVCNDLAIPGLGQVIIVTGSNMAGKSVFLKTVGVNLALAHAGGPVNARRLRTVPFRLFCSLDVVESVTDGISYFYAEVKRLKALLGELEREHPLPLLFCIDEIFRGTNNRERLIGSQAYVQALAGKHGTGLIATHDLQLTQLADGVPLVRNLHFRDRVVDGRMAFDYTLRPGPCPTTNALKIMQLEGLPVPMPDGD
jgi:hypothetical protein